MMAFGLLAYFFLLWAWVAPERFGKWLAKVDAARKAARQAQGGEE